MDQLVKLNTTLKIKGHFRTYLPGQRVWSQNHSWVLVLSVPDSGVKTGGATDYECYFFGFQSEGKSKKFREALMDPDWVIATQDELNQFGKADCMEANTQTK